MRKIVTWRGGLLLLAALLFIFISRMGDVQAHKEKHTPEQLKAFQDVFMEQVRIGDLLFHGDGEMEKNSALIYPKPAWRARCVTLSHRTRTPMSSLSSRNRFRSLRPCGT